MDNFTNETIDTFQLPRFEEVTMTPLHANYWKVLLMTWVIVFLVISPGIGVAMILVDDFLARAASIVIPVIILLVIILILSFIGFRKKAFAFRNHDVLFRYGIIATTTVVIPYNRIQHVALHEGFISRFFKLATVQIFTAGGSSSDLEIPGIEKEHAENIKQLLMGKIQKEL